VLFDAALEFGKNWRRDLASLAEERLPELEQAERKVLVQEIAEARRSIEDRILGRWEASAGNWSKLDAEAASDFVRATYPWMDERNTEHAVSQGTYYAWHG
jgi:hypothetical protein